MLKNYRSLLFNFIFFAFFCKIITESTKLFQLEETEEYLKTNCNSDSSAYIRKDPDNENQNSISFQNNAEQGDLYCSSNINSLSGNFEICFDYFAKDQDSGGCIGLKQVSGDINSWFACALRLNSIDSQLFYYLEDTNSWNNYCIQKILIANTNYQLVLQDYKNAGEQTNDALFKNIVVNSLKDIDSTQLKKQTIESSLVSSNFMDKINLNFYIQNNSDLLFQLQTPKISNTFSTLQQELYLLTGSSSQSYITNFNPHFKEIQIENENYYSYEQLIDLDNFKFNDDSLEGYPCNITNNIKICKGIMYFYYGVEASSNRQKAFQNCQKEAMLSYHFELRVNLSNNSTNDNQLQALKQISKLPCSSSDCTALIGQGEQANISYSIKMCKDGSDNCERMSSNKLPWGSYANFEFQSTPAILFEVQKAYIYLPFYTNSTEGEGEELNPDDIVVTHSKYGLLKIKYQVSSQASSIGNSVSLKFLVKQKKNSTRRVLDNDNNDHDDDGIVAIDLFDVEVLNKNQTLNYLVEDEEFEIVWWFYAMVGLFVSLVLGTFIVFRINGKRFQEYVKEKNQNNNQEMPIIQVNRNQP